MATQRPIPSSSAVVANFAKAAAEAKARYTEDAERRARAPNLLKPDEVAGDYDARRKLFTTLGGEFRPLTAEDLVAFRRNVEALGKQYRGGITPKQVVDRALPIDRDRSNREIRTAIPRQYVDGKMHFVTNASAHSDVTRHHVVVEFMNYGAAVSSPAKSGELVKLLTGGPVRFACDCGRHLYWYSYVATIGKFNASTPQLGFPKIRNPTLVGVACKHVLRVMQQLGNAMIQSHVAKMIDAGRKQEAPKTIAVKVKDAREMAALQAKQAGWKRNAVESSEEKRLRLAQQRRVREVAERTKLMTPKNPQQMAVARRKFEQSARLLAQMGGISQRQLADMLAKLNKGSK